MSDREDPREIDDGRTVADMSGVDGHGSILSAMIGLRGDRKRFGRKNAPAQISDEGERLPDEGAQSDKIEMTREERRWYILGALKAAILIFLAFAVGLGLVILLMVLFW